MPRSPRQQAQALAAEYDADLLDSSNGLTFLVNAWSPVGKVWVATDCHSLTSADTETRRGWQTLLDDMRRGMTACTQPDCDTCTEGPQP